MVLFVFALNDTKKQKLLALAQEAFKKTYYYEISKII